MIHPMSARLRQLVHDEVRQRREEGCEVAAWAARLAAAGDESARLLALYDELAQLRPQPDFPYVEPDDLDAIRAERPDAGAACRPPGRVGDALADRICGAWLGRCAGLVLGKPFECGPFVENPGSVRQYLIAAGAYPLDDYAPASAAGCAAVGRAALPSPACHRGRVEFVPPDDDIHYTIAALEILERHGGAFTTADVAYWWTHRLAPSHLYTAEEAALRNLLLKGAQYEPHRLAPHEWEEVRGWLNPYREWIGAQIRADGWGYACPGDPERAAELAWRDATLSHAKNGVYGAMFFAATLAAALVSDDVPRALEAGLGQIPRRCRLADALRRTIDRCAGLAGDAAAFESVSGWVGATFGDYHPVHAINNAAAVVAALLLGGGDFEPTITLAVQFGWDTDCNGATAGSVCGALRGAQRLPEKWIGPLNDTLCVDVPGYNPASIRRCAARHAAVARRMCESS